MNFFRQLAEKPWLPEPVWAQALREAGAPARQAAPRVALSFFIGVASILFFMLVTAYVGRMAFEDWRPAPQTGLLRQNTVMLVFASIAMQWARFSARRGQMDGVKLGMLAGGAFAAAFIMGQVLAWRQLATMTFFDATNPAIAFFYLITGLHVIHLIGGLVAWLLVQDKIWRGAEIAELRQGVALCTRYWHFLLIVWLVLFWLLFSGNDNLGILLALCGIR